MVTIWSLAQDPNSNESHFEQILEQIESKQKVSDYAEAEVLIKQASLLLQPTYKKEVRYKYHMLRGSQYFNTQNSVEAQKVFYEVLDLAKELNDSFKIATIYSYLGSTYVQNALYKKALENFETSLEYGFGNHSESHNGTLVNMALAYTGLNQYDKAIEHLTTVKNLYKDSEDYQNVAIIENNIGEIYRSNIEDYSRAKAHYWRAIEANNKVGDKMALGMNYHNLGTLYLEMGKTDSALIFANQSREYKLVQGDEGGLATSDYLFGTIYLETGKYDLAIQHFNQSLSVCKKYEIMEGVYFNSLELGKVYAAINQFAKSQEMYEQSNEIAELSGDVQLKADVNFGFYELYKKQNRPAEALVYYELAQSLSDSLNALKAKQNLEELRTQYEADLAETENMMLRIKEKAMMQELSSQKWLLFLSLTSMLLVMIGGMWLVRTLKQRNAAYEVQKAAKAELAMNYLELKKSEEKLEHSNDFKNNILSVLGHDLRSPLATTSSLLRTLSIGSLTEDEQKELFGELKKEIDISLVSLQEILVWSRLQMDELGKLTEIIKPEDLLKDVVELHEYNLRDKGLHVKFNVESHKGLSADINQMRSIFSNLLSNSIKFSPIDSDITIGIAENDEHVLISFRDNGKGISKEVLENLNTRTNRITEAGTMGENGTGIGLRIVKDFIAAHDGTLTFENNADKGTTVVVSIPKKEIRELNPT